MSRFLSPAWVDAFNGALEGVDLSAAGVDDSMLAASGRFRIVQVVLDAPPDLATSGEAGGSQGGTIRTILTKDGGRISLELRTGSSGPVAVEAVEAVEAVGRNATVAGDQIEPGAIDIDGADVTVVLSYNDAAALSRAELDPVLALSTGRVRVRGDLSVLVAGQAVLAAAAFALAGLTAATTY